MSYNNGNGYNQNGYNQNGYNYSGYNQNGYPNNNNNQNDKGGGYSCALASMICGICSLVFCGFIGIPCAVVAIVMYFKAKSLDGGIVRGMAKAGLICGIIGASLGAIVVVYYIFNWSNIMYLISSLSSPRYYY